MCKNLAHISYYLCDIKIKQSQNHTIMNSSVIFSERVLNTINSLPEEEKLAVVSAVSCEFLLGVPTDTRLTPVQQLLFAVIKNYILRDNGKLNDTVKMAS